MAEFFGDATATLEIYLKQSEQINQNWTGPKSYEFSFMRFFGCYDQNFIFVRETRH